MMDQDKYKATPAPNDQKPLPPLEQSLKYLAWDVKGINPMLEKIALSIDSLTNEIRSYKTGQTGCSNAKPYDDNPF